MGTETSTLPIAHIVGVGAETSTLPPAHIIVGVGAETSTLPTAHIVGVGTETSTLPIAHIVGVGTETSTLPIAHIVGVGTETSTLPTAHIVGHTPSTAFRHLPPNSARFSYATEGALFLSAQLSSDAASALRKFPVASTVILTVRSNLAPKHARKHETHPPRVPSLFKRLWFYLCWCKLCWRI